MKTEQPFTNNAQLDRFLTNMDNAMTRLSDKLDGHAEVHDKILQQTTATNGKVASIQKWRERLNGAIAVMIFLIPTILGFLGWMAYEISHLDTKIHEALSVYEQP